MRPHWASAEPLCVRLSKGQQQKATELGAQACVRMLVVDKTGQVTSRVQDEAVKGCAGRCFSDRPYRGDHWDEQGAGALGAQALAITERRLRESDQP